MHYINEGENGGFGSGQNMPLRFEEVRMCYSGDDNSHKIWCRGSGDASIFPWFDGHADDAGPSDHMVETIRTNSKVEEILITPIVEQPSQDDCPPTL